MGVNAELRRIWKKAGTVDYKSTVLQM